MTIYTIYDPWGRYTIKDMIAVSEEKAREYLSTHQQSHKLLVFSDSKEEGGGTAVEWMKKHGNGLVCCK